MGRGRRHYKAYHRDMLRVSYFLQEGLPPTFQHLPMMPPDDESTNLCIEAESSSCKLFPENTLTDVSKPLLH